MKIILISGLAKNVRSITFGKWTKVIFPVLFLSIPVAGGTFLGYQVADLRWQTVFRNTTDEMREQLVVQRDQVEEGRKHVEETLSAMTLKLAQMRSRLVRLDALGEQLTQIASLTDGEFDFSASAGLGGPEHLIDPESSITISAQDEIRLMFASMDESLGDREAQLNILQSMMAEDRLKSEGIVAGRPILKGWLSSKYGMRSDPFHGRQSWHNGVDFAGREGSDIISVASGVVVVSGERAGYGKMVEINHSDGYVTRYAHNKENVAKVGTIVKRGDIIARMGNTGRSTGPHVHFEVYKNGRTVDPATYIRRTIH